MWKWIKKLFTPKKQQYEEIKIDYSKLTKGDLKKEVDTGANGTQQYMIKEGINKNKIAKVK